MSSDTESFPTPNRDPDAQALWIGAGKGTSCEARAKLVEIVEQRKLHFEVEVTERERTIGIGTHQRRVIDAAGHGSEDG